MKPILIQFPPAFGLPNPSPFCMKLETWLRMAEIPYQSQLESDPRKAPNGKLPALNYQGQTFGDSSLIIQRLRADFMPRLDDWLSQQQNAEAHAIERMCENSLYWGLLHSRWIDPNNWPTVRKSFFSDIPFPVRRLVSEMVKRKTEQSLACHGLGNHDEETIYELCSHDMDALALILADKPFIMGDKPCTADAMVFALLANISHPNLDSPLREKAHSYENVQRYITRMMEQYFPEYCQA